MQWVSIHEIAPHLWAIDEMHKTTMFVYEGEQRVLLLDTGFGLADLPALVRSLCGDKPVIVVNTHAHGDHNGGNCQFDRVYCGRMDEPDNHHPVSEEDRQRSIRHFLQAADPADLASWQPGPARQVLPLSEGDVLDLGGIRLDVLETPGHTRGCITLFDRAHGYLFTGDLILSWQVWGQLACSTTLSVYANTLDRLAALQPEVRQVLPAHGIASNPYGYPFYALPPEVLSLYAEGTRDILAGKGAPKPFPCFAGDGLCQLFEVGGMVYDPERLGI